METPKGPGLRAVFQQEQCVQRESNPIPLRAFHGLRPGGGGLFSWVLYLVSPEPCRELGRLMKADGDTGLCGMSDRAQRAPIVGLSGALVPRAPIAGIQGARGPLGPDCRRAKAPNTAAWVNQNLARGSLKLGYIVRRTE
jgi:hypothetical protein